MATRKIFTTTTLTERLMIGMAKEYDISHNDLVNNAIKTHFLPTNEALRKEVKFLYGKLEETEDVPDEDIKACMARAIESLKNNPVRDVKPMEQVLLHYTNNIPMDHRYDYIQIVDTLQDDRLHRLNEILRTLDKDYTLGTREFGERSRTIFRYWDQLYDYPEIYVDLAIIIQCETTRSKLDVYRAIMLLNWLDTAIKDHPVEPKKEEFKVNLSLEDRYYGLRYEVFTYQTDNGYAELSEDYDFKKMSPEIKEYYKHIDQCNMPYYRDVTQEDFDKLLALESEGRRLFRRLGGHKAR